MAHDEALPFDTRGLSVEDMRYLKGALDELERILREARQEHGDADRAEAELRRMFRQMVADGYSEQAEQIFTAMLLALTLGSMALDIARQQARRAASRLN